MGENSRKDKKITILYFQLFTWLGGGEYSVYNLVKNIDASRFRAITMFNKKGPFVDKVEEIGVETVMVPFDIVERKKLLSPSSIRRNVKASFEIKRYIRTQNIDVIQCSDVFSLLLLLPTLLSWRRPVIYSIIVFYSTLRCWFFNLFAICFIDQIVTNSKAVKEDLLRKTIGLKHKTQVAYNGVDSLVFYPRSAEERQQVRSKLGLPLEKKIIGFVGRFEVWKGHVTFLEAAKLLIGTRDDLFFFIAGGAITRDVAPEVARYRNNVMNRIEEIQFKERLMLLDHRDDIPEIMAAMDVYVCSSDYEPFGLVALEAVASGVPLVASRTVGAMEVIGGMEGVFLAKPRDPRSFVRLTEQALRFARDREDRNAAKPTVTTSNQFTWRQYAVTFEQLYLAAVRK